MERFFRWVKDVGSSCVFPQMQTKNDLIDTFPNSKNGTKLGIKKNSSTSDLPLCAKKKASPIALLVQQKQEVKRLSIHGEILEN